jgi:hypothetical protein
VVGAANRDLRFQKKCPDKQKKGEPPETLARSKGK